jgi:hypothetical protein
MDANEASQEILNVDTADHEGRAGRLLELMGLLPEVGLIGFSGQAAQWLFEDVKATWLYGCFTSTVLTAHAFCCLQLAGWIRWLPDDPNLPDEVTSLEALANVAVDAGLVDVGMQARLLGLHDRSRAYTAATLHEYEARLERHLLDAEVVSDEHPLLVDARDAVATAVLLLYRR